MGQLSVGKIKLNSQDVHALTKIKGFCVNKGAEELTEKSALSVSDIAHEPTMILVLIVRESI